ncbi:MAG TPA: TlpA disulfide reductase family protein [Burkholderiales bacterium]|nr:TlpA disulfide reductase family protein [Burkholderiales bacterium]
MYRYCLIFAACVVSGAVFAKGLELDKPAPQIEGVMINGKPFKLSDYNGKVVLVNFWASWCDPCREEMPAIDAFYRKYRDRGFEVIAISMDTDDDLPKVQKVMQAFSFPAMMQSETEMDGYGRVWRIPITVVIDRAGIVRRNGFEGDPVLMNSKILEDTVAPLIAK